jgi:hypothetical protein
MTDVAPTTPVAPAPATSPPPPTSSPPAAAADLVMTPAAEVQGKIDALKANPEWVAKHLGGSAETRAEMRNLHELKYQHEQAELGRLWIAAGAPTAEQQLARGGELLREQALPENVVRQYEDPSSRITTKEYLDTKALKARLFADRAWYERWEKGDAEALLQMRLIAINQVLAGRGLLP